MTIPYHSEFAPNGSMDPSTYILNYLDDLQKPIALILASNFGLQGIRIKTIEIIRLRSNINWNSPNQMYCQSLKRHVPQLLCKTQGHVLAAFVARQGSSPRLSWGFHLRVIQHKHLSQDKHQAINTASFEPQKMRVIPQHRKAARCFSAARGSIWSAKIAANLIARVWSDWIPIYVRHSSRDVRVGFRSFSVYSSPIMSYIIWWLYITAIDIKWLLCLLWFWAWFQQIMGNQWEIIHHVDQVQSPWL